ncbi:hypothetical protein Tco_1392077, partial [Tanacetum coccineum]
SLEVIPSSKEVKFKRFRLLESKLEEKKKLKAEKRHKYAALALNVPNTSDRRLIELEYQVQLLMEAYIAPMQPTQVNKITSSCEICSGPHDTQYCMENPKQAFVEYVSSHTDKAGGLVSNFMASQDARLSKFEVDFKQQQSKMTNKIDTVLKAITDRRAGALPSDTVKNSKLNVNSTSPVLSVPEEDECKEEQRDAPHPELKDPTDIKKIGPSRHDEEREIECEDDYDRGYRKPSDLEDGIYRDTIKLGPEYVIGIADEREVM